MENQSIGSLLSKANYYVKNSLQSVIKSVGYELSTEQWVLLNIINYNPDISQIELSKIVIKDKTNITRMIDVLERDKYVKRDKMPSDRRAYKLNLTDKGKEFIKIMHSPLKDFDDKVNSTFDENELLILKKCLIKLINNFNE